MPLRFPPLDPNFSHFLHGGDYNPEQWLRTPEVWDEDMRLMRAAHCNVVSLGIFSWAKLEPEEGRFEFGWLDQIIEKLHASGVRVTLATPTGARPAWLAAKYPEVLRVDAHRRRQLWGQRHNHCLTSPVYREKSRIINARLAGRYGRHPALILWHVNNEYSGDCHCDLCREAFRAWLRRRYRDDLDALNHAWWSTFWSHTITDWNNIDPPSPLGENSVHGQNLDWARFVTDQTIDYFRAESAPLREITPHVSVTTNFMGWDFTGLDYYKLARELDVVSWDSYPTNHDRPGDYLEAIRTSFLHHQRRAMLQKPFLLMESTPGIINYRPVAKLKRPGLLLAESIQAVAHGSASILYFQWRKSRGSVEKFHGAVVDHYATTDTRTFREVTEVGRVLQTLDDAVGTTHRVEAALIYDYENLWAINDAAGPREKGKDYPQTCCDQYAQFWSAGVGVDVIPEEADFERYKLLIAPMLYMVRPGVAERIERFVENGGTFVTTYLSGIADESDLCFQNGFPGPLHRLMGLWAEELDALYDDESVPVIPAADNESGLTGVYTAGVFCDLIHEETAKVLATYGGEFYAGRPALTVNRYGKGRAYYIASRNDARFTRDFYDALITSLRLRRALGVNLPAGVTADVRLDGEREIIFVTSFHRETSVVDLGRRHYADRITGRSLSGAVELPPYGVLILDAEEGSPQSM